MLVALIWSTGSAVEKKKILSGSDVPPIFFLGIIRFVVAVPTMIYASFKKAEYIDHLFLSFVPILLVCISEVFTITTYFIAINYLYVSYIIAIKRAGNIIISIFLDIFVYKEPMSIYTIISALLMMSGVVCIILSQ